MVDPQIRIKISDRPRCVYWMRALSWRISVSLIIICREIQTICCVMILLTMSSFVLTKCFLARTEGLLFPSMPIFFKASWLVPEKLKATFLSFFLLFFFFWKLELIYYRKCLKAVFFDNRWPHLRLIPVTRLSLWGHQGSARSSRGNPLVPLNN